MTVTSIDLCSRALVKIGASSISSFDEGTAEAHVAASIYPAIRDGLLSAHPWNFAIAQQRLARLATSPIADYENSFALPEDSLRVLSAGAGVRGRGLAYRIQQRTVCADASDVVLTYIYRAAEADFPPLFQSRADRPAGGRVLHPPDRQHQSLGQLAQDRRGRVAAGKADGCPGRHPAAL